MHPPLRAGLALAAAALLALPATAAASAPPGAVKQFSRATTAAKSTCAQNVPGRFSCFAKVIAHERGGVHPLAGTTYSAGYRPADLQDAYKISGLVGNKGKTVAIVDAYDDPNAESDLAVYRDRWNLPRCTTANGCFKKLSSTGGSTSGIPTDPGWAGEISLDLDMVSAACPRCKIRLIEADSASFDDLKAAVKYAKNWHIVSNSYGVYESNLVPFLGYYYRTYGGVYKSSGVHMTVSTGDDGYGPAFPADSPWVTATGGTNLYPRTSSTRGWEETAWDGAGSGCSRIAPRTSWEATVPGCGNRPEADTASVADPYTGVAVYDTYDPNGQGYDGWLVFGGTSAAAPFVAGLYGLANNTGSIAPYAQSLYSHTSSFFDVTTGANGLCGGSALCIAGPGWDGPTGLGTPRGIGAF